jgi:hypothetical protein
LEGRFLKIAEAVPQFGGIFYDSDRRLRIAVTSQSEFIRAQAVAGEMFRDYAVPVDVGTAIPFETRFSYSQLHQWKRTLVDLLAARGATGFAVVVAKNAVEIGSPGQAFDELAIAVARNKAIPLEAIWLSRRQAPRDVGALWGEFRPAVPGGAGIWRDSTSVVHPICTLAVNVRRGDTGPWFGLTASHCTRNRGGGADNTAIYQGGNWDAGSFPSSTLVGAEVDDPQWQTVGCGSQGTTCRYADVAVIGYTQSGVVADSGWIAVTDGRNSTSVNWIDKATTSKRITSDWGPDQPFEGQTIDRVGAKTGWHSGIVVNSCLDLPVSPALPGYLYLCQTEVSGGAPEGGDSGGPAFSPGPGGGIMFAGIVWGAAQSNGTSTGFIFSSVANIRQDLGNDVVFTFY